MVHKLNKRSKWTKWTRKVVPMMGQKCTMKRPAYDAGARGKRKTPAYNAGIIDEGGQTSRCHAKQKTD